MYKVKVKKKYKVTKQVVAGEHYIEHIHQPFASNFIGQWIKSGVTIFEKNQDIVSVLLCEGCVRDARIRRDNFVDVLGPDWNVMRTLTEHSYQVENVTMSHDIFDWGIGKCSSYDRHSCWTAKDMIFDVMRKGYQRKFVFSRVFQDRRFPCHCNPVKDKEKCSHEVFEEVLYKMFINLNPGRSAKYEGKATIRGSPTFFWPGFLKGHTANKEDEVFYVWCKLRDNHQLEPEERIRLREFPIRNWVLGDPFVNYSFVLPQIMQFDFFLKDKDSQEFPKDFYDMRTKHKFIGRTVLEMYPAGGAFRSLQYKWVSLEQLPDLDCEWEGWSDPYYDKEEAFIPKQQSGLIGPIVSYWSRVHDHNRK